ncbi:MAG: 5-formyltetrahydrofolate cyclo-ligase [Bdellovibrionota bacterium]
MVSKTISPIELKEQLRTEVRARRKLFSNPNSTPNSIHEIDSQSWFRNAQTVAIYISQTEEFPTRGLFDLCIRSKKTIVAPVMHGNTLRFRTLSQWNELHVNAQNILEPSFGNEIDPKIIDVFFVPLLAFDRSGNRLGRGGKSGGYYDRLFSNSDIRGKRVGVGFGIQECFSVPTEPHDAKMDYILTDRCLIKSF